MGGGANSSSSTSTPLTSEQRFGNFAGSLGALSATAVRPEFDSKGNVLNAEDVVNSGRGGFGALSQYNSPDYEQAQIVDPGAARTSAVSDPGAAQRLAGGDYNKLEQSMLTSRTAPLEYALGKAQAGVDADAAKRGVWSSGLAVQSSHDLADRFAPELKSAAADASTARIAAEQGDNNAVNSFNLSRSAGLNSANLGQDSMVNNQNLTRANNLTTAGQTNSAQTNSFNMENANRINTAAWAPANYLAGIYNGTGGQSSSGSGSGWNI